MPDENKPAGQEGQPPEGATPSTPAPANSGPSVEELQKQNKELQERIEAQTREKDAKIADLENTNATIAARQRQIDDAKTKQNADESLKQRISKINERRSYDPEGADSEMASLLSEQKEQAAKDAVSQAQHIITQQTTVEKLKSGIKTANPDFDDDIVDVIMQRANVIAGQGKAKSADDAIKQATEFVKQKLESYAQKKNAAPPLPPGARAEGGGANQPPPPPEPVKEKTALEEIDEHNAAKSKRTL